MLEPIRLTGWNTPPIPIASSSTLRKAVGARWKCNRASGMALAGQASQSLVELPCCSHRVTARRVFAPFRCSLRAIRSPDELKASPLVPRWRSTRRERARTNVLSAADHRTQAGAVLERPDVQRNAELERLADLSYSAQYDRLFQKDLDTKTPVPKPSKDAQSSESGAKKVLLSDVYATAKTKLFGRPWNAQDYSYTIFMTVVHGLCLLAPATFSWPMVGLFFVSYFITGCLGITLSFHRQLSHKAFRTPKWLEYALAYCGVLAVQGDPIEWASSHRYHHLHTDTPLDPHSPYEGFWWSHMGWLLNNGATLERVGSRGNTGDLDEQPFYRFIQKTYVWHVVAMFVALYAFGGLPAVVWGGALRAVWVYHITWFVNSASHCWGYQTYKTGDLSRNNWWVAVLAFGEGWHNNHHAFEYSARHGLDKGQFDMTWQVIAFFKALGLASHIKGPSEKQMNKKREALQAELAGAGA